MTPKTNFVKLYMIVEHLRLAIHWLVSQFYEIFSSGTFFSFYAEMMLNKFRTEALNDSSL